MAKVKNIISICLLAAINVYRYAVSGLLGNCCRFEPTCSAYAMEAIKTYGAVKGSCLAVRRVSRCHPWCPGGIDPVP